MAIEEDDGDAGGIPEWVVTFGDMMSLLLTFFIMLVSLSEIKEDEKFQAMVDSFVKKFGYSTAHVSQVPGQYRTPKNGDELKIETELGRAVNESTESGGDKVPAPAGEEPRVRMIRIADRTGMGVSIPFDEGRADPPVLSSQDAAALSELLAGKPQRIEIRSHTAFTPVPRDSGFSDHDGLAFAQANNIKRLLVDGIGIDPERIRLAIAGPYEPIYLGTDPKRLHENARVEVYLLNESVSEAVGTEEERQQRYINDNEF